MTKETIDQVEDLLAESLETFNSLKSAKKQQKDTIKQWCKQNGVDPQQLKRVIKFKHNWGKSWNVGDCLEKDPLAEQTDKLQSIFIKLKEAIIDLSSLGLDNLLTPFIKKLKEVGIVLDITDVTKLDLSSSIEEVLDNLERLETNIETLDNEIKQDKASESENIGFVPKSNFSNILSTYSKITEGNADKVEDKMQNTITNNLMIVDAIQYLNSKIEK